MKEYTYSIARVRAKEASLLNRQDMEQLLSADGYEAALRFLRDHGWRFAGEEDTQDVTEAAERELWDFLQELADEDLLRLLRIPIDYHNVKASVKAVFSGTDGTELLLGGGTADGRSIYEGVKSREYGDLAPELAEACSEATSILLRTQDGQLCDIFIDHAMLRAQEDAARESGSGFLQRYAALLADIANLKTAYRCAASERSLSFLENAVYEGGSLDTRELTRAAAGGTATLREYLASTPYAECAEAMKRSAAAFEKQCTDEVMRLLEGARYDSFSCAPIIAYYYAKSAEISAVRLILSGKRNRLDDAMIRERVPETYV